ncbi:hypothetical protein QUB56_11735 [Microcoleus sp. AR_TQ3_B6]|uniref:hypothetical protein n=1 Tax=Microcoleus sp. AR_TQ3_B6 TaxID=3055284 RepID=UPI002FD0A7C8
MTIEDLVDIIAVLNRINNRPNIWRRQCRFPTRYLEKAVPFPYPISVENRYIEESPSANQTRSPIIKVTPLQPEIRRTVKC